MSAGGIASIRWQNLDRPAKESAERRQSIRGIAEALFAERGFFATSMRDIAAAANVNVATVYYHCGSKAQLFLSIYGDVVERMTTMTRTNLAGGDEFGAVIVQLVDRVIRFFVDHPTIPRILQRVELGELSEIAGVQSEVYWPLVDLVDKELRERSAKGEVRSVDSGSFLTAAAGVILALSIAARQRQSLSDAQSDWLPVDAERLAAAQEQARSFVLGALGLDPDTGRRFRGPTGADEKRKQSPESKEES